MTRECRTQAELEKALADKVIPILLGNGYFTAYGSSQVRAYDSAQVTVYSSAQVTAYDSAQVRAYGSAQVTAYGSAQVTAYDSAQVTAYDSAQVTASKYVAVTDHGYNTNIHGGVLITIPKLDTPVAWCEYHDIPVKKGVAILFKAVTGDWKSGYGWDYSPGATPETERFVKDDQCGNGLHMCAKPLDSLQYHREATRYVACPVRLSEMSVIDDQKVKVKRVIAPGCREVTIDGTDV